MRAQGSNAIGSSRRSEQSRKRPVEACRQQAPYSITQDRTGSDICGLVGERRGIQYAKGSPDRIAHSIQQAVIVDRCRALFDQIERSSIINPDIHDDEKVCVSVERVARDADTKLLVTTPAISVYDDIAFTGGSSRNVLSKFPDMRVLARKKRRFESVVREFFLGEADSSDRTIGYSRLDPGDNQVIQRPCLDRRPFICVGKPEGSEFFNEEEVACNRNDADLARPGRRRSRCVLLLRRCGECARRRAGLAPAVNHKTRKYDRGGCETTQHDGEMEVDEKKIAETRACILRAQAE